VESSVFGLFKFQGMFMKGRDEVVVNYDSIIANEIIASANITDAILTGTMSDRLFKMVQRHV
jgi:hypothetical protein